MPSSDYLAEREERERERARAEREASARTARDRPDGGPNDVGGGVSDFDEGSADIPIWGWLSGATARRDAAANREDQESAERAWMLGLPSVDELTPDYALEGGRDEFGSLEGDPSAIRFGGINEGEQAATMRALRDMYEGGGYTAADMGASRAMRGQQAQALGSANAATLQQMQARGMGGSGAELAARMGGAEAMAGANSQADAGLQMAAMERALAAMQGHGAMATAARSQDLERENALDAFNRGNMDWRRGREERNTGWANRFQDARASAHQQDAENRMNRAAGQTQQYQGAQSNRRADGSRQAQSDQAAAGALGTIISEIL